MNAARTTAILTLAATLALSARAGADTTAKSMSPSDATATAPATFKVKMSTTKGDFVIEVHRDWAPLGADRFYNLVKLGYFDDARFFRVIQDPRPFMVQFGINGTPSV